MVVPPIIGCPADGQQGAEPAPTHPKAPTIHLPSPVAARLAYYQGAYGLGVLAPRGWHCLNLEGSSGDFLLLTPSQITGEQFFAHGFKGVDGPAIQLGGSDAGTSGRFEVAAAIRRVFPAHKSFADQVLAEGLERASDMPTGPYPADKLSYRSPDWVEYTTPASADGFGTHTHLNLNGQPISGFLMLAGDPEEFDLVHFAVRLGPSDRELASVITLQAEADARSVGPNDSKP